MSQNRQTYDANLVLKTSGAVTADTNNATILDFGAGRCDATAWLAVTAIDVASGDERYVVNVQGSASSTFASGVVNLASWQAGDSSTSLESADSVIGTYEMPFTTEKAGTVYRYVRISTDVAGTTPSITFNCWATK